MSVPCLIMTVAALLTAGGLHADHCQRCGDMVGDGKLFNSITQLYVDEDGSNRVRIAVNSGDLSLGYTQLLIRRELFAIENDDGRRPTDFKKLLRELTRITKQPNTPVVALSTFIIPECDVPDGVLVKSATLSSYQTGLCIVLTSLGFTRGMKTDIPNLGPEISGKIAASSALIVRMVAPETAMKLAKCRLRRALP